MTGKPIRLLICEDVEDDALLVTLELKRSGFEPAWTRVQTARDFEVALARERWDLVISDYTMPRFGALEALETLKRSSQADVPFIIVSGSIGEETAVDALKAGAADFVVKSNLSRLAPAIERELREAQVRMERREALIALEQAVRARDEFLGIAAHELKTPLTALQLLVQTLGRGNGEPPTPARLDTIRRSTARLVDLVQRLLEISRLSGNRLELQPEQVDLRALVLDVVDRLAQYADRAGCSVQVRAPGPVQGRWDRARLESVASNLLSNALKYGPGKPVEVEVSRDERLARLVVVDHGIGIAPEDQGRIFDKFERAVSSSHYGGLGLGLWLSRKIVEAHRGALRVQSHPGNGSTFEVTLPVEGSPGNA